MKGFVFTVDALFAAIISITLGISLYLMIEGIQAQPTYAPIEKDLLSGLDKLGKLNTITGTELASILSKNNRCGSLTLKRSGIVEKEVVACACDGSGDFYSSSRSLIRASNAGTEYLVATLRTCLKS